VDPNNISGKKKKLTIEDFSQVKVKFWVLIMDYVGSNLDLLMENLYTSMIKS
jgi:hypothetical protein